MANILGRAAARIRASGAIYPVFIAFLALTVIGAGLCWEDITTSYFGYLALPTRKANDWVALLVAILPSVGQVAFSYLFIDSGGKNKIYGAVFLLLHCADVITDVNYKAHGMPLEVWGIAFAESEILYTLGSELAFMTGLAMVLELLPDVWRRLPKPSMEGMVSGLLGSDDEHGKHERDPRDQRDQRDRGKGGQGGSGGGGGGGKPVPSMAPPSGMPVGSYASRASQQHGGGGGGGGGSGKGNGSGQFPTGQRGTMPPARMLGGIMPEEPPDDFASPSP